MISIQLRTLSCLCEDHSSKHKLQSLNKIKPAPLSFSVGQINTRCVSLNMICKRQRETELFEINASHDFLK